MERVAGLIADTGEFPYRAARPPYRYAGWDSSTSPPNNIPTILQVSTLSHTFLILALHSAVGNWISAYPGLLKRLTYQTIRAKCATTQNIAMVSLCNSSRGEQIGN